MIPNQHNSACFEKNAIQLDCECGERLKENGKNYTPCNEVLFFCTNGKGLPWQLISAEMSNLSDEQNPVQNTTCTSHLLALLNLSSVTHTFGNKLTSAAKVKSLPLECGKILFISPSLRMNIMNLICLAAVSRV